METQMKAKLREILSYVMAIAVCLGGLLAVLGIIPSETSDPNHLAYDRIGLVPIAFVIAVLVFVVSTKFRNNVTKYGIAKDEEDAWILSQAASVLVLMIVAMAAMSWASGTLEIDYTSINTIVTPEAHPEIWINW